MNWINEKPATPGWYWYRDATPKRLAEVRAASDGELTIDARPLSHVHGAQFAGPIPEPGEGSPSAGHMDDQAKLKKFDEIQAELWAMAELGNALQSTLAAAFIRKLEIPSPTGDDPESA